MHFKIVTFKASICPVCCYSEAERSRLQGGAGEEQGAWAALLLREGPEMHTLIDLLVLPWTRPTWKTKNRELL